MEHRNIGSLSVSVIGIGCNNFGGRIDEAATQTVVATALEVGINFFDTADVYGGTKSEELLGRALGKRRDDAVIATKFGMPLDDERKGANPAYIERAVEDSLRRLGTDRIDLYQLHAPDPATPIADTLGALDELVRTGKVREIGCSNFSAEQIEEADQISRDEGRARFVSVQNEYSILRRGPERWGVLDACEKHGLGFLPYFPLNSGVLSGKYRRDQPPPAGTRLAGMPEDRRETLLSGKQMDKVEALEQWAAHQGHSLLELAFAWLLARPVVSSVIAGATKAEQVRTNAEAASWSLTSADLDEVDAVLAAAS